MALKSLYGSGINIMQMNSDGSVTANGVRYNGGGGTMLQTGGRLYIDGVLQPDGSGTTPVLPPGIPISKAGAVTTTTWSGGGTTSAKPTSVTLKRKSSDDDAVAPPPKTAMPTGGGGGGSGGHEDEMKPHETMKKPQPESKAICKPMAAEMSLR